MRGYIRKDWYLSKKRGILLLVAFVLIMALSYLLRFAFDYGNLKGSRGMIPTCDMLFSFLPGIIFLFISVLATIDPILQDKTEKWNLFLFSGPVSNKKLAAVKLAEVYMMWFIGCGMMLCMDGIYGLVFGFEYSRAGIFLLMVVNVVTLILNLVSIPFSYRCKSQNGVVGRLILCFVLPVYLFFFLYMMTHQDSLPEEEVNVIPKVIQFYQDHLSLLVIVAVLLIGIFTEIAYYSSLSVIKRRHVLCGD